MRWTLDRTVAAAAALCLAGSAAAATPQDPPENPRRDTERAAAAGAMQPAVQQGTGGATGTAGNAGEIAGLAELARRLDDAHVRGRGAIEALEGVLELHTVVHGDGDQQQRVVIPLEVRYRVHDGKPLLRYGIEENGERIERGLDDRGAWSLVDGQLIALRGRDYRDAAMRVRQHAGLAAQILRYLSPGDELRALADPSELRAEVFATSGRETRPAVTVDGRADGFPFYALVSGRAPAHLQVWVDAEHYTLLAVAARPIGEDGAPADERELLIFRDHTWHGGRVRVPKRISVFREAAGGRKTWLAHVDVDRVDLDPSPALDAYQRPSR